MEFTQGDPNFGQQYTQGGAYQKPRGSTALRILMWAIILIVVVLVLGFIAWIVWYRDTDISLGEYYADTFGWITGILLWPFKFLLGLFGFIGEEASAITPLDLDDIKLPIPLPSLAKPSVSTKIVRHDVSECPPCEVDVKCPPCDDGSGRIEPLELEIKYLKDMVKFSGSIAKRENAINAQYRELYPGFNVLSPHVRKLSHEYNYIKNEIRKDKDEWQYFKNYFSKLTNIPSTTSAVHYDVLLD